MLTFLTVVAVAIYQIIAASVAMVLVEMAKFVLIALVVAIAILAVAYLIRKVSRRHVSVVEVVEVVEAVPSVELVVETGENSSVQEEGPICAQCGDSANLKIYRDLVDRKSGKKTRYYLCDHACTVKWVSSLDKPWMYVQRPAQTIQTATPTLTGG